MRTFTEEHRRKISKAKKNYYSQFTGKRPYTRSVEYSVIPDVNRIKNTALELIEKFNDINREYGDINEEIIDKEFRKEQKKYEYVSNFF